jgi:hypothetical protein
VQHAKHS